jgi:hypothetical protein
MSSSRFVWVCACVCVCVCLYVYSPPYNVSTPAPIFIKIGIYIYIMHLRDEINKSLQSVFYFRGFPQSFEPNPGIVPQFYPYEFLKIISISPFVFQLIIWYYSNDSVRWPTENTFIFSTPLSCFRVPIIPISFPV